MLTVEFCEQMPCGMCANVRITSTIPSNSATGRRITLLMLAPQCAGKIRLFMGESEKTDVQVPPIFSSVVGIVIPRFTFQVLGQVVAGKVGSDLAQDVFGDTDILGGGINERPVVIPQDGVNLHKIPPNTESRH